MITINNMNNALPEYEFDVRVDRKTIFGNPFRINNESERDAMLDQYERYFYERVENDIEFKNAVDQLIDIYKRHGRLNLFCWCYPKRCHSETIEKYVWHAIQFERENRVLQSDFRAIGKL